MKHLSTLFLSFVVLTNLYAQLSQSAEMSLLTASPGKDLYAAFGHSGLRVKDDSLGLDSVYNWGTFNFNTDNFYLKFIRGNLMYSLSVSSMNRFMAEYYYSQRSVYEQKLNLSNEQINTVYKALLENKQPENREYLYDFYFDNCATRIRDILEDNLGEALSFNYPPVKTQKTFRQLLDEYVDNIVWIDWGFDLILGINSYKTATQYEYMFLPDYLMEYFGTAQITIHNEPQPLVKNTKLILDVAQPLPEKGFFERPVFYMWCLFILVLAITVWQLAKNKKQFLIDYLFITIAGLCGTLFLCMWLFTAHHSTYANFNMLWAFPVLFLVYPLSLKLFGKKAILFYLGLCLIALLGWYILPQQFNVATAPLIGILMVRYVYQYVVRER